MSSDTKGRFLGLFIFGTLAIWITLNVFSGVSSSLRSEHWPKAPAQIVSSGVVIGSANVATRWIPHVEYVYVVGHTSYRSSRIRFLMSPFYQEENASAVTAPYPVGRSISVAYDPAAPKESVLEPGPPPGVWKQMLIALFFCSLSGYIFFEIGHPERRVLLRSNPEIAQCEEEEKEEREADAA